MSVAAQTLLDAVDAAILGIAGGAQSVTVNGQSFGLPDIGKLFDLKRALEAEIAATQAASAGRGPFVNVTLARFR